MSSKVLRSIVCLALMAGCSLGNLRAQQRTATLMGTVFDPGRAIIPGATVTATHVETNQRFTAVTNASGDYALPALPEGQYAIIAAANGFTTQAKSGVILIVGETVRVDFNLTVGATSQVVQATAQAPQLETTNANFAQAITPQMVEALPLNQRDIVALTTLAPGVLPPRGMVQGGNLNSGGFIVRGMERSENIIYLNGAVITQGNGAPTFLPNIDALQEFQVMAGLYGPQYGLMDGGQLVVVTKSGGNRIHGDAFEYLRNDAFDAINYFQATRQPYNRNDFGGTFGGPIYIPKIFDGRNKAWFFLSLEKVITNQYDPLPATVPTDAEKQGQFPSAIIDPTTGQAFPNNTIPSSRISPIAQQFLQFLPEPNVAGSVNYFSPDSTENSNTDQIMVKVDYQQNPSNRWWGQYIHDSSPVPDPEVISRFSTTTPLDTTVASFGNVHTFGGKYVNDVGLHFFRRPADSVNSPAANCTFASSLGIPDFPTYLADRCGVPDVSITGIAALGDSPDVGPDTIGVWWLPEELSFQKGKHFVEAGFDWRREYEARSASDRSSLSFTNIYSGNAFANFLLGLPTSSLTGGAPTQNQAQNSLIYWVRDTWRTSSKLTLDLGLRYEYRMPLKDKRGYSSNFNPQTGALFPALNTTTGRYVDSYPLVTYRNLNGLMPRIGLAYQLPGNTVLHAGYSLYAAQPISSSFETLGANPRPGLAQLSFSNNVNAPLFTLSNPFPAGLAGQATPSVGGIASPFKLERSHEWGLSLQTAFSQDWTMDLGYDGSHTQNVVEQIQFNDAPPGPGAIQPRRPYPSYAAILFTSPDADASYNGLDARVEKRAGKDGLTLLVATGWSKAIDNSDSRDAITGENAQRSINMPLSMNRGLSSSNIGLRFVVSLDYQLPFGNGRAFVTEGLGSKLAGGWSVQTITTSQSGPWFTVFLAGDPLNTGDTNSEWPNLVCNPNLSHSQRTVKAWFETSCFAAPPPYTYGNAGRSTVQATGIVNSDIAIHRAFHFVEGQSLEFRLEAFDSLNHPNFGLPGSSFAVAGFGTISSALTEREVQLGFKYIF